MMQRAEFDRRNKLWEYIGNSTTRLKIPGGWLVRTEHGISGGVHLMCVPDPRYRWKVEEDNGA